MGNLHDAQQWEKLAKYKHAVKLYQSVIDARTSPSIDKQILLFFERVLGQNKKRIAQQALEDLCNYKIDSPQILNEIGEMYQQGRGVKRDYAVAMLWFEAAEEKGYLRAKANIGFLYEFGYGVEKNYVKAWGFYKDALDLGYQAAAKSINEIFTKADGKELFRIACLYQAKRDFENELIWLTKADEKSEPKAAQLLGLKYEKQQKYLTAAEYYHKAHDRQFTFASKDVRRLLDNTKLSETERKEIIEIYFKMTNVRYEMNTSILQSTTKSSTQNSIIFKVSKSDIYQSTKDEEKTEEDKEGEESGESNESSEEIKSQTPAP